MVRIEIVVFEFEFVCVCVCVYFNDILMWAFRAGIPNTPVVSFRFGGTMGAWGPGGSSHAEPVWRYDWS